MKITFLLVEPAVPENIGATARALNTMGFSSLRIINPQTSLEGKAMVVAHGSRELLENAEIFSSYMDAIGDLDFIIATSAKKRRTNENYVSADSLPTFLKGKDQYIEHLGIVFGREESGLTNEEISSADVVSYIPLKNPYPSLNLSHAVMIYAYELSGLQASRKKGRKANPESIRKLKEKVEIVLKEIEIKQSHIIGPRIMERISFIKNEDLSLLHSILSAILEEKKD
jgi:tRNA/rRNA methyltransferase